MLQCSISCSIQSRGGMNMNTTLKTTKEETADKQTELVESITSLYTSSVERLAEAQKNALDVALEQNADLMGAWKKIAQVVPGTPVPNILDLVANTFGQFVDLQKGAIDLALEQSQTLAALANERVDSVSKATDAVATIVQDTVERAAVNQ